MSKRIKIYRWRRRGTPINNFGDELTIPILDRLFGIEAVPVSMQEAELIGAGSILDAWCLGSRRLRQRLLNWLPHDRSSDLHVWGSGFILPDSNATWPQRVHYHAVRGDLSAARLGHDLALGDPGILASLIVDAGRQKNAAVGLVLHYADANRVREDALPARWTLINPEGPVDAVLGAIAACELIVSSSLHGLIAADSFGIPCVWVQTNNPLYGATDFKFLDYASARGAAFNPPVAYDSVLQMQADQVSAIATTVDRSIEEWQQELIRALPKEL